MGVSKPAIGGKPKPSHATHLIRSDQGRYVSVGTAEDFFMNQTHTINQHIRATMRAKRQALGAKARIQAGLSLHHHLLPWLQRFAEQQTNARTMQVAGYWAVQGEMPLAPSAGYISNHHHYLLPCLASGNRLSFARLTDPEQMEPNRFGIPEPIARLETHIPTRQLDVVLTPLLAFNKKGARLGMGGGFYDRTFAFRKNTSTPSKPWLIGVAYDFQACDEFVTEAWDVPLDLIITDQGSYPVHPDL